MVLSLSLLGIGEKQKTLWTFKISNIRLMRTALFKITQLTSVETGRLNKLMMICSIRAAKGQQYDLLKNH